MLQCQSEQQLAVEARLCSAAPPDVTGTLRLELLHGLLQSLASCHLKLLHVLPDSGVKGFLRYPPFRHFPPIILRLEEH